jgi:F-type H+/Na+-transporting ATPase subunit alpha
MVAVRPDEVSAILREQLAGAKTEAQLEEVGTVLQVGDGVARIYGLTKVQAGELIVFENGLLPLTSKKITSELYCSANQPKSKKAIP